MAEKGLDENDLIFDPTESTLEEFLTEWKYRVKAAKASGFNYSDTDLGFKLIKSLDFSNRKAATILEHVDVQKCIKIRKFLQTIETTVRKLEASQWNWEILQKKPAVKQRWYIDTKKKRSKNVLEDCSDDFFELLLKYIKFDDKKNLCLISKRMCLRMNELEESIRKWNIKLNDTNYSDYTKNLKSKPYKDAQKDIFIDFTDYTGLVSKDVVNLVDGRTKSISGLNFDVLHTFVKARKTFENVESVSIKGVKNRLTLIAFLNCSELTPKKLTLTNCKVDKKVVDLGFETFSSLEDLSVRENCMKLDALQELLRKASKTLKTLEVQQSPLYPFDIKIMTSLKFAYLQKIVIDLKKTPFNFHTLISTLEASTESLEELTLMDASKRFVDSNNYQLVKFPKLKAFEMKISISVEGTFCISPLEKFPFSMQALTKLDVQGFSISANELSSSLDACSQTLLVLRLFCVAISGPLVLTQSFPKLKYMCARGIRSSDKQHPVSDLLSRCGSELQYLVLSGTKLDITIEESRTLDNSVNFPKLQRLEWIGKENVILTKILQSSLSTLKELNLYYVDMDKIQVSENIESLLLRECRGAVSQSIRKCSRNLSKLTIIKINNVNFDGNQAAPKFPKLKVLTIADCNNKNHLNSVISVNSPPSLFSKYENNTITEYFAGQ